MRLCVYHGNRMPPPPTSHACPPRQGLRKPAPAAYGVVTSTLRVAPSELLFVDDRRPNVDAAAAAGWGAVHFVGAAQLEEELVRRGLEF